MIRKAITHLGGLLSSDPLRRVRSLERLLAFAVDRLPPEERRLYLEFADEVGPIVNGRLYRNRVDMLAEMPKGGRVGEVGVYRGHLSEKIASICAPDEFHLFDIDFTPLELPPVEAAMSGKIIQHLGDSVESLSRLDPSSFNWLYIDGDHSFDGAYRDLVAGDRVLKPGGFMMCNDYANWSANAVSPYGVRRAVNKFVNENSYEVVGFALASKFLPDILIKKPSPTERE